ncbi:enterobactin transporter EntS, partial [Serratia sp. Se-PFBMAAmG]|nr:enterobactin transporter EntS [Serratia sp. Se-PFBMAAmG]
GYSNAIASLLQFILIQHHTPDALLGRVNSLGTAQDVSGDSLGALGLGALARMLAALNSVLWFGGVAAGLLLLVALAARGLRTAQLHHEPPAIEQAAA